MTLDDGLQRAMQEWRHISNFDQIIYYEMAAKFKEFEIEEESQIQMLEEKNVSQCSPPPAPPRLHPQVPPGTVESQQPVSIPKKSGPKAEISSQRQHRHQQTLKTKAPKEIPPEAVKEYRGIMDGLVGPLLSASEGEDGKWEEEEHEEQQEDDGASRPTDGSTEEEDEELPSLAFLLAPHHRLLPWGLVKSPLPGSDRHTSGVTGARGTSLHISSMKRGHNQTPHPAAKFPKTALIEGPSSAASMPHLRADFRASGRQPLVLGASQSSQPLKRRYNPLLGHI